MIHWQWDPNQPTKPTFHPRPNMAPQASPATWLAPLSPTQDRVGRSLTEDQLGVGLHGLLTHWAFGREPDGNVWTSSICVFAPWKQDKKQISLSKWKTVFVPKRPIGFKREAYGKRPIWGFPDFLDTLIFGAGIEHVLEESKDRCPSLTSASCQWSKLLAVSHPVFQVSSPPATKHRNPRLQPRTSDPKRDFLKNGPLLAFLYLQANQKKETDPTVFFRGIRDRSYFEQPSPSFGSIALKSRAFFTFSMSRKSTKVNSMPSGVKNSRQDLAGEGGTRGGRGAWGGGWGRLRRARTSFLSRVECQEGRDDV